MSREKELLKKIKEGEPSGVDELIAEYYRQIFRYCLWHTADRQTAEDAAQEVFAPGAASGGCAAQQQAQALPL